MKFNKSFAIQDSARKRELSQPDKGHPSQVRALSLKTNGSFPKN
jgi:hypothetical protein